MGVMRQGKLCTVKKEDLNLMVSGYVAIGTEIRVLDHRCDYVGVREAPANGLYFIGEDMYIMYRGGHVGKKIGEGCKLLLHPLERINDYYVNEVGRPVDRLCDMYGEHDGVRMGEYLEVLFGTEGQVSMDILGYPLRVRDQLVKWHFDIYGLIGEGYAVERGGDDWF